MIGGFFVQTVDLIGFKYFAFAFQEHRSEGIDARAEPSDLARVKLDCFGEFLFGQFAVAAVGKSMLEGIRDQIGVGFCQRAGELHRVEFLVDVDDPADVASFLHRSLGICRSGVAGLELPAWSCRPGESSVHCRVAVQIWSQGEPLGRAFQKIPCESLRN